MPSGLLTSMAIAMYIESFKWVGVVGMCIEYEPLGHAPIMTANQAVSSTSRISGKANMPSESA